MRRSRAENTRHLREEAVDCTFELPFLAQLWCYLQPFEGIFPDRRLYRRFVQLVKGLIAAKAPIITQIAAAVLQSQDPKRSFHVSKRYYRWLENARFQHRHLLKPAYARTREQFGVQRGGYTLVILDFTNLEKPYGWKFESLSTLKATGLRTGPRCRQGKVPGYNQLVGLAVGKKQVGLTFAKTISYVTSEFVSLNREIFRAIRYSHVILRGHNVRFICDRGFDDEKTFSFVTQLQDQFVIRLYHERTLLVAQGAAQREKLLATVVRETPRPIRFQAWFKIRGRWRESNVTLGYRQVWIPSHQKPYWLLVSDVYGIHQRWMLLTNVPLTSDEQAKEIWFNYRRRWQIESSFRFLQKEGLRWEDFKVLDLEPIRRLINVALVTALFLLNIRDSLDETALQILLTLGGKQGLTSERDGPYLLLRGLCKFLLCLNVMSVLKRYGQLDALLQYSDAL